MKPENAKPLKQAARPAGAKPWSRPRIKPLAVSLTGGKSFLLTETSAFGPS